MVEIRLGGVNLRVRFSFLLMLCIFLIKDINNLLTPVLAAIFLHEMGHFLCMLSMGMRIQEITLSLTGIHIQKNAVFLLPPLQEIIVHLSGPLTNIATAAGLTLFPLSMQRDYFFVLNIMMAIFNLLPIGNLDGANVLRTALSGIFRPREARIIFMLFGVISAAALLWGLWIYKDIVNLSAIILWIYLLYMTLKG